MRLGPITRDRLKQATHLVNRTYHEVRSLPEFHWLLVDRLNNCNLPDSYRKILGSKKLQGQMWNRGHTLGVALDPQLLREFFGDLE